MLGKIILKTGEAFVNIIFYILASPYLIPLGIIRYNINRRWRKNVKAGDVCYFINKHNDKQRCVILGIADSKKTARVEYSSGANGWLYTTHKKIIHLKKV